MKVVKLPARLPLVLEPPQLADRDLAILVGGSEKPVVIESFYSGWEKPWRALGPADWTRLRRELGERVCCATIETGQNRVAARRYGLETIPQLLIFVRGEVFARFSSLTDVAEVIRALDEVLRAEGLPDSSDEEPARAPALQLCGSALAPVG
jgi:thioredoxin-like negative regulator of GroEL